jgi:glycerol-3-phosphate acyltransferase PlsX
MSEPDPPPANPIALDAMGSDRGPAAVVAGAVQACKDGLGPIVLVGEASQVQPELDAIASLNLPISLVTASEVIGMAEHPGRAARTKRDSSMHVGFRLLKDAKVDGFVSAGNSGAMMAVGLLTLRRVKHCDRPAIASTIPSRKDPIVLLDMGANVECRASHLVQFALMGSAYAQIALGKERPTVALLSNGTEPTKGTQTLREAHRLLCTTDLRYLGYIEGRDLPLGVADVVVTDGFVGNVVLKLSEGIAIALLDRVRDALKGDWMGTLGAALMRKALKRMRAELDWANIGGAPLLGLEGNAVVAHGSSDPRAFSSAIRTARDLARLNLVIRLSAALEEQGMDAENTSTAELPITRTSGMHDRPDS